MWADKDFVREQRAKDLYDSAMEMWNKGAAAIEFPYQAEEIVKAGMRQFDEAVKAFRSGATSEAPAEEQTAPAEPVALASGPLQVNQFDQSLAAEEAQAACGPAAAVAFARASGRNPTMREALELAKEVGWTPSAGMAGPASQKTLLDRMGVGSELQQAVDWNRVTATAQGGRPVTISTPGHYFVADAYDPQSGRYRVGASGTAYRGGKEWMTREEMEALGGAANAALYLDAGGSVTPEARVKGIANEQLAQDIVSSGMEAFNRGLQNFRSTATGAADWAGDLMDKANRGFDAIEREAGQATRDFVDEGMKRFEEGAKTLRQALPQQMIEQAVKPAVEPLARTASDVLLGDVKPLIDPPERARQIEEIKARLGPEGLEETRRQWVEAGRPIVKGAPMSTQPWQQEGRPPTDDEIADQLLRSNAMMKGAGSVVFAVNPMGAALTRVEGAARPITATAAEEVQRLRLDKFPDWARDTIQQAAEGVNFARVQRRGVIGDQTAEALADDLDRTFEQWVKQGKAGATFNTEETRALRNAVTAQAGRVNDLARNIAEAERAGAVTDLLIARAHQEGEKLQALVTVAEGARAEWGRAGRAWQAATRSVDLSPTETVQRIYKKLGGRENALAAVQEYNRLLQQGATPIQMAEYWARVEKPPVGFQDWFRSLRYNSMMSGPRTVEVNWIGNSLEVPWRLARDFGASTLRGHPEEIGPEIAGIWIGAQKGARGFLEVLTHGITQEQALAGDLPQGIAARLDDPLARGAATALEIPGRLNAAADEFARQVAYAMSIGRDAAKMASGEGLTGEAWGQRVAELTAKPPAIVLRAALEVGDRMTFKGDMGALGQALEGFQRLPYLGNIILPFLRTVYHITARGIDRSPLGIAGTGIDVARGVYAPGKSIPKGVVPLGERLGDNIMGGLTGLFLVGEAMMGNISAAGPEDQGKRELLRRQGWQPYSVKIGDKWVSYSNWGVAAVPFALAGSTAEAMLYRKPGEGELATVADAFRRFGELATEQTYLQGVGNFYRAIRDPERYGAQWFAGFMQTLIPYGSALNTVGQATDPYQRRADAFDAGQIMAARLPGLRESVPVARGALGEPVTTEQTGPAAFMPLRTSTEKPDAAYQELERLGLSAPGKPERWTTTAKGEKWEIPDEQYRELERTTGDYQRRAIAVLMKQPAYERLPIEEQRRRMQVVLTNARRLAREDLGLENDPTPRSGPQKYIGVSDPARERKIDRAITRYRAWSSDPRRNARPTPEEMRLAVRYEQLVSPKYTQWQRQQVRNAASTRRDLEEELSAPVPYSAPVPRQ